MDPIVDIIIAAAVGAGTSQVVDGIVALGKASLPVLWQHLSQKGKRQFEANLTNFSSHFISEVRLRIESGQLTREQVADALDRPDVVSLVIDALAQAAQTDKPEKHLLLAKLVAEGLGTDADSELAVVSRLACSTIPNLSSQHLKILALRYTLFAQRYNQTSESQRDDASTRQFEWLIKTFEPYQDVIASPRDAEHLAAVGCFFGKQGFLAYDLKPTLTKMVSPDLDIDMVMKTSTWQQLETVWNNARLAGFDLTSVGSLIGMYTADILANRQTDLAKWLNRS